MKQTGKTKFRRTKTKLDYNEEEVMKYEKWSPEYKRVYQQLYYRVKEGIISESQYKLFMKLREKHPNKRGAYNYKNTVLKSPEPRRKISGPVIISFD